MGKSSFEYTSDRSPFVADIHGWRSLVKPPFSECLYSGSVTLAPGESVGKHNTNAREEMLVVLFGQATLICNGQRLTVNERQLAYIPPNTQHDVINASDAQVEYVFIVTPV